MTNPLFKSSENKTEFIIVKKHGTLCLPFMIRCNYLKHIQHFDARNLNLKRKGKRK